MPPRPWQPLAQPPCASGGFARGGHRCRREGGWVAPQNRFCSGNPRPPLVVRAAGFQKSESLPAGSFRRRSRRPLDAEPPHAIDPPPKPGAGPPEDRFPGSGTSSPQIPSEAFFRSGGSFRYRPGHGRPAIRQGFQESLASRSGGRLSPERVERRRQERLDGDTGGDAFPVDLDHDDPARELQTHRPRDRHLLRPLGLPFRRRLGD